MNFEFVYTKSFGKEFKKLASKYPSLKSDFLPLVETLDKEPVQGDPLGNNCYKIRLSISSKGKGKSGGARVITCVKIVAKTIYFVSIYDKSEKESISTREIQDRMRPYLK